MVETNFSKIKFDGNESTAESLYKGFEPLTGDDVADTVVYATNLPQNIQIAELTVMPTCQTSGTVVYKKG